MKKTLQNLALIASIVLSSCDFTGERIDGNGNITSVTRQVNNTEKIKVEGEMDVFLETGASSVRIEADENIIPFIETVEEDGWLRIRTRDNTNINTSNSIKVYVTSPRITDIHVDGSGNVTGNGKISSSDDMSFDISGSGNINVQINAPRVEAAISGSGNLNVAGETRELELHIAGSGNYRGADLKAENARVDIAGSGDASLFADVSLKASIAGSGDVKYRGNATIEKNIAGSGSVRKE